MYIQGQRTCDTEDKIELHLCALDKLCIRISQKRKDERQGSEPRGLDNVEKGA